MPAGARAILRSRNRLRSCKICGRPRPNTSTHRLDYEVNLEGGKIQSRQVDFFPLSLLPPSRSPSRSLSCNLCLPAFMSLCFSVALSLCLSLSLSLSLLLALSLSRSLSRPCSLSPPAISLYSLSLGLSRSVSLSLSPSSSSSPSFPPSIPFPPRSLSLPPTLSPPTLSLSHRNGGTKQGTNRRKERTAGLTD